MANVKYTKRKHPNAENNSLKIVKTTCPQKNIQCSKCTTKVSTIPALKRHMNNKHSVQVIKYQCRICMKNYCRKDVATRHVKNTHQEEDETTSVQIEVFSPRKTAEKPLTWKRPFEARHNILQDLNKVKFRIVAAVNKYGNPEKKTTAAITKSTVPIHITTLEEDLYLSSDDENTENSHHQIFNYATEQTVLNYENVSSNLDDTFCLDENQNYSNCQDVQIDSVYDIFQSTTKIYSCYSLSLY